MLTDTARPPTDARNFLLRALAGSLGLFGLLRLPWVEAHVVLPVTRLQAGLGAWLLGAPTSPVEATLACSGTDALALCLGAVVAYPVTWTRRLAGAAGGTALILGLNTLRIGTLGRVASSPAWFNALHVYVWPAVLTVAIAGYVFWWMSRAEIRPAPSRPQPSRRFVVLSITFLFLFAVASPLYLESHAVLALGGYIARVAALTLGTFGVDAHATGNVLMTPRGAFMVTQECVATPLIPVYLAAVCAYALTWRRWIIGALATLPLFTALGIARLLVVAIPQEVASPEFLVHAFYQLLAGVVVVFAAAMWCHRGRSAAGHALAGLTVGILFVYLLGPVYTQVITARAGALDDPQGAIALLPAFQAGLYLALWAAASVAGAWKRILGGLAVLGITQAAGLLALHALAGHAGLTAHVRDVRGWAVAGPVLIFAAVVHLGRARR